jgi:hypothetical protein
MLWKQDCKGPETLLGHPPSCRLKALRHNWEKDKSLRNIKIFREEKATIGPGIAENRVRWLPMLNLVIPGPSLRPLAAPLGAGW